MTGPLYAIGRFCSRHHWPVIALWIVAAIALLAISQAAGSKTSENLTLPGTDSTTATELLEDNLPEQAYGSNPLVFEAPQGKLSQAKYATAIDETAERLNKLGEVNSAVSPLSPQGARFLSEDGSVGYIPVVLNVGPGEIDEEQAERILDAGEPAEEAGLEVAVGSYVGQQLSKPETETSEAIGLAAAVVILLFAFGTATAMMLPIVSAVLGLACALSIIRLLEHVLEVPGVAATLATMIGLGVGIDYALFIVTRHKLQLGEGMELRDSIARATATAGGAVVFAGFTVVIALCSLAFAGIPLVSTLGFTAAVAVLVAVTAATTLLPAMLGALGPRINSLRVKLGKTHPDDKEPHGWRRWAERVSARPGTATAVSMLVLVVLALPIFQLDLGQNDISALPKETTSRQAYDALNKGFGPGVNGPLLIASEFASPAEAKQVLPALQKSIDGAADVEAVGEATLD
ncbi:MAG TPA: MMPL family transporter, partial [Solirubrobacterales bacterium]|nr:MMPL family transporter [Solirubrobacterales bacterium]